MITEVHEVQYAVFRRSHAQQRVGIEGIVGSFVVASPPPRAIIFPHTVGQIEWEPGIPSPVNNLCNPDHGV
jgi:hypothetical protein